MELSQPEMSPNMRSNSLTNAKEYKEFCIANITLNGLQYGHSISHDLIIYGTKGYLAFRNGNLYGKLKEDNHESLYQNGHLDQAAIKENMFYLQEFGGDLKLNDKSVHCSAIPHLYELGFREMVQAVSQAFSFDDIKHESDNDNRQWTKKPVEDAVTLEEAGKLQMVIDAIKHSAQTHQWIRVNYD